MSPRSSSWASAQPGSPTCFWPSITCTRLDQSVNSLVSCLSSSLVVVCVVELPGPIADVEPMDLPADAPADDAPGRLDRGTLILGQIGGKLQNRLDRLLSVKALGPTDRGRVARYCAISPVGCFRRHCPRRFSTFVNLGKDTSDARIWIVVGAKILSIASGGVLASTQSRKDAERKNVRITRIDSVCVKFDSRDRRRVIIFASFAFREALKSTKKRK